MRILKLRFASVASRFEKLREPPRKKLFKETETEVERAWARARRPGPQVRFLLNNGKARTHLSQFLKGLTTPLL